MNYDTLRDLDRDPILYTELRNAMLHHCKSHGITSYAEYFADLLRFTSRTRSTQLLGSIQDYSTRKFSLDEFAMVIRHLDENAAPVINRLIVDTGLVCIPLHNTDPKIAVDFNTFSLLNSVKTGVLSTNIMNSIEDGKIDKDEKIVLLRTISELIGIFVELRETIEADNA